MFWNAWDKLRGMPREEGMTLFIQETDTIFAEEGKSEFLENPNWPGPKYYDDCKKFSWVEVLVENNNSYYVKKGQTIPEWKKLQEEEDKLAMAKFNARMGARWTQAAYFMVFL